MNIYLAHFYEGSSEPECSVILAEDRRQAEKIAQRIENRKHDKTKLVFLKKPVKFWWTRHGGLKKGECYIKRIRTDKRKPGAIYTGHYCC